MKGMVVNAIVMTVAVLGYLLYGGGDAVRAMSKGQTPPPPAAMPAMPDFSELAEVDVPEFSMRKLDPRRYINGGRKTIKTTPLADGDLSTEELLARKGLSADLVVTVSRDD